MKRAHLLISGRVQGVYYRATTEQVATRMGLRGWVRNLPDGRVEAIAEGPADLLERFVAWCHEGPPAACVEQVDCTWGDASGEFCAFETRH
ncbi:MAG TPA: acylphosphatase [Oscillatoriaceae cyanobacterium]